MPLFDHFNLIAPFYERVLPMRRVERFKELAGLPVDGMLLDAAGGTGRVSHTLKAWTGPIVVADEAGGMLAQARQKSTVFAVQCHAEALPFADKAFDRVIMVDALHHVQLQGKTAGELWRVVKPGGRIVIEEPDVRNLAVKFVALAEKLALMRSHFLSPDQIAGLFRYPQARTEIVTESYNAWIIVSRLP